MGEKKKVSQITRRGFEHAEAIGIGSQKYNLIRLDA